MISFTRAILFAAKCFMIPMRHSVTFNQLSHFRRYLHKHTFGETWNTGMDLNLCNFKLEMKNIDSKKNLTRVSMLILLQLCLFHQYNFQSRWWLDSGLNMVISRLDLGWNVAATWPHYYYNFQPILSTFSLYFTNTFTIFKFPLH